MSNPNTTLLAPVRILIAASGSGGHLFPALQIARAIQTLAPQAHIQFIGSGRPLEERFIDRNGFSREVVKMVGLKRLGVRGILAFLTLFPRALWQIWRLVTRLKPHLIIGVGGYVSVAPVIIGRLRGIPTWIHEAELKAGMANTLLSFFASTISTAFEEVSIPCARKVVYTGHPVRSDLTTLSIVSSVPVHPNKLLIMGGSQGADALDSACIRLAPFMRERGLDIWHQCRPENRTQIERAYREAHISARVEEFIEDLSAAYRWCDLIVSRAGAGSVMEIGIVNKPAVLVPYPHAQAAHQLRNAHWLAAYGKAVVIEENLELDRELRDTLSVLLRPEEYMRMVNLPPVNRSLDAAARIAEGCIDLAITCANTQ